MTWARNYSDRNSAGSFETGKRAKKPARLCLDCGAGIAKGPGGRKRCRSCADIRNDLNIKAASARHRARQREKAKQA